jgi:hypothetical protein
MSKRRIHPALAVFITLMVTTLVAGGVLEARRTQSQPARRRVVLVSVDAGAAWLVNDLVARHRLASDGAFMRARREGSFAREMIPQNGAATAPSHAVLFTGALPGRTGGPGHTGASSSEY